MKTLLGYVFVILFLVMLVLAVYVIISGGGLEFLIFGLILTAIALISTWRRGSRRLKTVMAVAKLQGLRFLHKDDRNIPQRYSEFICLRQGKQQWAFNLLEGTWDGQPVLAFDYHYSIRFSKRDHHYYFSAVLLESEIPLKPLLILSDRKSQQLAQEFGFQEIQFDSPEFSRDFIVRTADKEWTQIALNSDVRQFLLNAPRFSIQFDEQRIMVFHNDLMEHKDYESAVGVITGFLERLPGSLARQRKME
jgi:hypothetical protein